jgi:hypothetical protein
MFTNENTTGFTEEELDDMNEELHIAIAKYDPYEFYYHEYVKNESERILKNHGGA